MLLLFGLFLLIHAAWLDGSGAQAIPRPPRHFSQLMTAVVPVRDPQSIRDAMRIDRVLMSPFELASVTAADQRRSLPDTSISRSMPRQIACFKDDRVLVSSTPTSILPTQQRRNGRGSKVVHTCPTCCATFEGDRKFARHLPLHSTSRPFLCQYPNCYRRYKSDGALSLHQNSHGGKRFACAHCGKKFTRKCNRTRHQEQHCGKRPIIIRSAGVKI